MAVRCGNRRLSAWLLTGPFSWPSATIKRGHSFSWRHSGSSFNEQTAPFASARLHSWPGRVCHGLSAHGARASSNTSARKLPRRNPPGAASCKTGASSRWTGNLIWTAISTGTRRGVSIIVARPIARRNARRAGFGSSALRDIQPGEEITFNYGYDLEAYEEHPCHCGAAECVGFIVAEEFFGQLRRRKIYESPPPDDGQSTAPATRHTNPAAGG